MPVLSSYVRDHAALLRMSANADFSTPLKCLASGKKSVEQLRPSTPPQTSALELLVVYCFHILLVYPCALYYGMLILSRAHEACLTLPLPALMQGCNIIPSSVHVIVKFTIVPRAITITFMAMNLIMMSLWRCLKPTSRWNRP